MSIRRTEMLTSRQKMLFRIALLNFVIRRRTKFKQKMCRRLNKFFIIQRQLKNVVKTKIAVISNTVVALQKFFKWCQLKQKFYVFKICVKWDSYLLNLCHVSDQ